MLINLLTSFGDTLPPRRAPADVNQSPEGAPTRCPFAAARRMTHGSLRATAAAVLNSVLPRTRRRERFSGFSLRQRWLGGDVEITNADMARAFFLKKPQLRYRPLVALLRSAFRHQVMIVADGEEWRRTHEALVPHLAAGPVDRHYAPVIKAAADRAFAELAARAAAPGPASAPVTFEIEPVMRAIVGAALGHVLFGATLSTREADYLERLLDECTKTIETGLPARVNVAVGAVLRVLGLSARQRFLVPPAQRRSICELLDWVCEKIELSQAGRAPPPLIASLAARFAHLTKARAMRCIAAECVMLLVAGIDTTAAVLTFAIVETANNPALRDALAEEARRERPASLGSGALTLEFACLYRVIRETMRRHTVVPTLLRELDTDQTLDVTKPGSGATWRIRIKRGHVLRYLPVVGNMRASVWHHPRTFDPGRFARPLTTEQKKNYHTFGLGPQSCPGRALAITESILILRSFFATFDLEERRITQSIPVERNAMSTIRPVGQWVAVHLAPAAQFQQATV